MRQGWWNQGWLEGYAPNMSRRIRIFSVPRYKDCGFYRKTFALVSTRNMNELEQNVNKMCFIITLLFYFRFPRVLLVRNGHLSEKSERLPLPQAKSRPTRNFARLPSGSYECRPVNFFKLQLISQKEMSAVCARNVYLGTKTYETLLLCRSTLIEAR